MLSVMALNPWPGPWRSFPVIILTIGLVVLFAVPELDLPIFSPCWPKA